MICAGANGFDGGVHGAVAGDNQKTGVGLAILPMAQQVHAGDIAHLQVGQDEIDRLIKVSHRLIGGVGGANLVAGIMEEALETVTFILVVFNDKDFIFILV